MPKLGDKKPPRPPKMPVALPAPDPDDDDEDFDPPKDTSPYADDPKPGETPRETRIRILTETDDDDLDRIKKWSCTFFRPDNPECTGCRQPEDKVLECRDYYLERIVLFPEMDAWAARFDLPVIKVRDKVSLAEIKNVGVTCDACYMSAKCPMMEKNASCAIDFGADPSELTETKIFDTLIELQHERVRRQSVFEKIDGGVADGNLSVEIDRLATLVERKANRGAPTFKMTVEGSGEGGTKAAGGLLSSIFGKALGLPAHDDTKTIDIPYAEPVFVEEPKDKKRSK